MAHLIDKDALVAEIERRKDEYLKYSRDKFRAKWSCGTLDNILSFLDTLEVKEVQEEPVSDDLEEEIIRYIGFPQEVDEDVSTTTIRKAAHHFANWQKEQFEKNRLAACDRQTEEEAEIERDFVMGIIEKEHRQPTFDDAIKYGYHQAKKTLQLLGKTLNL